METVENKYKKDVAEPETDVNTLNDIFDVSIDNNTIIDEDGVIVDISTGEILDKAKQLRKELKELSDDLPDVDLIITNNIDRANRLLDALERDITGESGSYTASLIEAVGKLMDVVTSSANSITGMSQHTDTIRQKERALDIQEKKVMLSGIVKGAENVTVNNNNLIMNREELMKMLEEDQ